VNRGFYTGVGSRRAPQEMVDFATHLARALRQQWGLRLRTGGAEGVDIGFERGDPSAELLLPWNGYNGRYSDLCRVTDVRAYKMAASIHPKWERLSGGARAMHARNVLQVLGEHMGVPSKFVICWTPDGCESEFERSRETGGTATAIVTAARHGIPVFNLAKSGSYDRFLHFLPSLL